MHSPVSSSEIVEKLIHLRDLFRQAEPGGERGILQSERREAAIRDLLSNIPRISKHPTLRTVLEIADIFSLTLGSAHSLFGYNLDKMRDYDRNLNSGRTHIVESYSFNRDLLVDLPSQLGPEKAFTVDALLRDLVFEWRSAVPIRALQQEGWERPGTFYVQVGTEDSLGSSIPPGALALVEPVNASEAMLPNPRAIYLLQFANGYRCSHCVVTGGKLILFSTGKTFLGREQFAYPGSVRVAGRIRMFALHLPMREYPLLRPLPPATRGAELTLPWEHLSRDLLLATKHKRFRRTADDAILVREVLEEHLHANLSGRTERRYRGPTSSSPHVNVLMHLALTHMARYTDLMRTADSWHSDQNRFSLEALLSARSMPETGPRGRAPLPTPKEVWEARRKEFGGWPSLLSVKFPNLRQLGEKVVRLAQGSPVRDLNPKLGPGSLLLLDQDHSEHDPASEASRSGWARSLYIAQRGTEIICGRVERYGSDYVLLEDGSSSVKASFQKKDLGSLKRVIGAAVPV